LEGFDSILWVPKNGSNANTKILSNGSIFNPDDDTMQGKLFNIYRAPYSVVLNSNNVLELDTGPVYLKKIKKI
jgi:hypothetical protein